MAGYYPAGARPKHQSYFQPDPGANPDHNLAMDAAAASAANRRRKKRGNSGLKTVDVTRGRQGFGFTLSGQNPCILSSVIAGSPAERVGLVSGNCLVAVDGQNCSRMAHGDVVKLISGGSGVIRVTVGDSNNYRGSETSSDEEEGGRVASRPKYSHHRRAQAPRRDNARPLAEISTNQNRDLWLVNNQLQRPQHRDYEYHHHQSDTESSRIIEKAKSPAAKHVRSNSADSSFVQGSPPLSAIKKIKNVPNVQKKVELNAAEELTIGSELNNYFKNNLSELRKSIKLQNHRKLNVDLSTAEYKCVVGYLGKWKDVMDGCVVIIHLLPVNMIMYFVTMC